MKAGKRRKEYKGWWESGVRSGLILDCDTCRVAEWTIEKTRWVYSNYWGKHIEQPCKPYLAVKCRNPKCKYYRTEVLDMVRGRCTLHISRTLDGSTKNHYKEKEKELAKLLKKLKLPAPAKEERPDTTTISKMEIQTGEEIFGDKATDKDQEVLVLYTKSSKGKEFQLAVMTYYEEPSELSHLGRFYNKYGAYPSVGQEVKVYYTKEGYMRLSLEG